MRVVVLDAAGRRSSTVTDEAGRFAFVLPPGVYSVEALLFGFIEADHVGARVDEGRGTGLDILLEPAIDTNSLWHVLPWDAGDETPTQDETPGELSLAVRCVPTVAEAGRPVTCAVEAVRRRFRGYGMLVAEIGLPPGAEVDRASLDDAVASDAIQRYEIWMDRVVAYLWPRPGGVRFDFRWHPRLAMTALSTPSSLYDYYNPSSQVVLPPQRWQSRSP